MTAEIQRATRPRSTIAVQLAALPTLATARSETRHSCQECPNPAPEQRVPIALGTDLPFLREEISAGREPGAEIFETDHDLMTP
jgi:hypothetical protein